ncbi:MAG: hypothetical protein EBR86_17095 [Planctomycetia bacterium]|nr:hypothetical protein [Planctomycetia bacterium]
MVVSSHQSPEIPTASDGAPGPEYHVAPSRPAGPCGPGVPSAGCQTPVAPEPTNVSTAPSAGPVGEMARPWSWVALPLVVVVVE